jgi:hypothetical protein
MKRKQGRLAWLLGLVAFALVGIALVGSATAQVKKTERYPAGPHEVTVELRQGTVVLVTGNHLVTRLENGQMEAIEIPEDFRFHENGRLLSLHELRPGMLITHETITTSRPILVQTVEVIRGTISYINGPHVIIRDENNKLHDYMIPDWAEVVVDGQKLTVFELREGMKINTTILTEATENYVESEEKIHVRHPSNGQAGKRKEPEHHGVPAAVNPPQATEPNLKPRLSELPGAGSPVPLAGLLGLLSLAASIGLRELRRQR